MFPVCLYHFLCKLLQTGNKTEQVSIFVIIRENMLTENWKLRKTRKTNTTLNLDPLSVFSFSSIGSYCHRIEQCKMNMIIPDQEEGSVL